MDFPGFQPGNYKILFFSRGRGRGHVIPDMQIVREIQQLRSDVDVCFVSYGTGAATLLAHGVSHIDLKLPDRNSINETIVLAGRVIGSLDPDLVVAHEEFSALPAAKIFHKPTVMITDWFTDPDALSMASLRLADRILFLDAPGIYPEPPWVVGRVEYLGPVLRNFRYRRSDREKARRELDIPLEAFVLAVLPGSWRESEVPILHLVLQAFDRLEEEPRHLVWVAGEDRDLVHEQTKSRTNVIVENYVPEIDRIMVAADVVITKGNRKTLSELDYLGIPTVSISDGANPIDYHRASLFRNNRMLSALAGVEELATNLQCVVSQPNIESTRVDHAVACAHSISEFAATNTRYASRCD